MSPIVAINSGSPQKKTLLQAALQHVLQNGLGDLSLRSLANEIGTSHRMLIYHFGSADGFWEAVLDAVRHSEQAQMVTITQEGQYPSDLLQLAWKRYSSPDNLAIMRLVFEIYGRALRTPEKYQLFLDDVVNSWLQTAKLWLVATTAGDETEINAHARLIVATMRGLLLDLLTTGDYRGADQAFQLFLSLIDRRTPQYPANRHLL